MYRGTRHHALCIQRRLFVGREQPGATGPLPPHDSRGHAEDELPLLPLLRQQVARSRASRRRHLHGMPHGRSPDRRTTTRRRSRSSPAYWNKKQPVPWVRIHKLPEYVHFPHMRHVNAGVTCQTCHGQIQNMKQVYQASSLNMGWCVNCHIGQSNPPFTRAVRLRLVPLLVESSTEQERPSQ